MNALLKLSLNLIVPLLGVTIIAEYATIAGVTAVDTAISILMSFVLIWVCVHRSPVLGTEEANRIFSPFCLIFIDTFFMELIFLGGLARTLHG